MKYETYETLAVNIKVEIFDLDMRETIWPMSDDLDDKGVWMPKDVADKHTDDEIGKWFLNRYLIDYGNSYQYSVTRGEVEKRTFKRKIAEVNG
jgi:hypothetical protein